MMPGFSRRTAAESSRSAGFSGHLLDLVDDFAMFRESPDFVFAPNRLAIGVDVEYAARSFDHCRFDLEDLPNLLRQTGGFRQIVSLNAVLDSDVHHPRSTDRPLDSTASVECRMSKGKPDAECFRVIPHSSFAIQHRYARFMVIKNSALVRTLDN